jgi:hypothetical protein
MPDFEYIGHSPGMYPMLRDSYNVPAGTVKPGDVLRFEEAPDADWVPYEAGGNGETGGGTPPGGGTQDEGQGTPQDPGSEQGNDDTAGQTGSEEQ